MKIAVVSSIGVYPERLNGPAINAYSLTKALTELGNDCCLIAATTDPHGLSRALASEEFETHAFLKSWGQATSRYEFRQTLSDPRTLLSIARRTPEQTSRAGKILEAYSPEIVFFNLLPLGPLFPLLFSKLDNAIYVLRSPVWLPFELEKIIESKAGRFIGTSASHVLAKRFDAIVTQSTQMQRLIRRDLGSHPDCLVIPNGVDTRLFRPNPRTSRTSKTRLLFVGRLSEEKGVDVLINALAALEPKTRRTLRLVIVGSGGKLYATQLRRQVRSRGLQDTVQFAGAIDWKNLPRVYRSSDIFVLPSRWEAMPLSLLEAMASGLPPVCSDIPGVTQTIVHGRNGLIFTPGDHRALADRLTTLIDDTSLRKRLGANAYATAQSLSWNDVARCYLRLFTTLQRIHPRRP